MSEGYEGSDFEHGSNLAENDSITFEDALAIIAENRDNIIQLQKDYADLLKKIISIQSGIASIEKRILPVATIQASAQIRELKESVGDDAASILEGIS